MRRRHPRRLGGTRVNTTEKLQSIRAECERLLAIAEKRTPGKWGIGNGTWQVVTEYRTRGKIICEASTNTSCERDADAAFIASAAGPFEASLKSTIAAIDKCVMFPSINATLAKHILFAWEGITDGLTLKNNEI